MKNLRHIWFIGLNDVRGFLTDRLAVGVFILFPFLFIVMFNMLLGNVGAGDRRLELHLATQETAGISVHLIQAMTAADDSQLKPGQPKLVWDRDYSQAKKDVESGKIGGILAFPADFTEKVESGQPTSMEIIVQAEDTDTRMALNGLAQSIASQTASQTIEVKAVIDLMKEQGASGAEIQQAAGKIVQNISSNPDSASLIASQVQSVGQVKQVNASSFVVPGYLVMFVFFAAAIGAVGIIRERQNHTLERLMAGAVRRESILGGYFLGGIFRGLVQIAIFWTVGILVFHVDIGASPAAVIGLSLLVVLMSAAFSLLLATVAKTDRAASSLGVLCSLFLAALGGCWWPQFIEPQWMQFLAKCTPHGWATDGFNKLMLSGASAGDVIWQMIALAGFTTAFVIIAVVNFRTNADGN
jgi:ABC-2 type transport system permease protein